MSAKKLRKQAEELLGIGHSGHEFFHYEHLHIVIYIIYSLTGLAYFRIFPGISIYIMS